MAKNKKTYTKQAVKAILFFAILDLQASYVLAFLGREQIAESLSGKVVECIIGVMLGYFMKSFFETKEEENLKFKREINTNKKNENDDDVPEGFSEEIAG